MKEKLVCLILLSLLSVSHCFAVDGQWVEAPLSLESALDSKSLVQYFFREPSGISSDSNLGLDANGNLATRGSGMVIPLVSGSSPGSSQEFVDLSNEALIREIKLRAKESAVVAAKLAARKACESAGGKAAIVGELEPRGRLGKFWFNRVVHGALLNCTWPISNCSVQGEFVVQPNCQFSGAVAKQTVDLSTHGTRVLEVPQQIHCEANYKVMCKVPTQAQSVFDKQKSPSIAEPTTASEHQPGQTLVQPGN